MYAPTNVKVAGKFVEVEGKQTFEFSKIEDGEFVPFAGYEYKVWVGGVSGNQYRYAHVVKTRCYMVCDEAADGSPVVETWVIKNRVDYAA